MKLMFIWSIYLYIRETFVTKTIVEIRKGRELKGTPATPTV